MKSRSGRHLGHLAWPLAIVLSTSIVVGPVGARAEGASLAESLTGQAKSDFSSAVLLFRDGDYAGSITKFRAAYDASKDPRLLWNMAACEKNLRHYSKVDQLVRRYLAEAGPLVSPDGRAQAVQLLEAIHGFMSPVDIAIDKPQAEIFVDDEKVGTSPMRGAVNVDIGRHRIRAQLEDLGSVEKTVEIAGSTTPVDVDLSFASVNRQAQLSISVAQDDASISVDGRVVGVKAWEGSVPAGGHTIRVTASGRIAYASQLEFLPNTHRTVTIELEREHGAAWPWILAGSILGAGALGVGAYFLFKPKEPSTTTVAGTLPPNVVTLPLVR